MNIELNWESITTFFFAITFVFVIIMAIGFYVNYKREQKRRNQAVKTDSIQGRFFQRYIPEDLKDMKKP